MKLQLFLSLKILFPLNKCFWVLSKWALPAESFSLVLTIILVVKEFTRGRETRLNIIRLCYSRNVCVCVCVCVCVRERSKNGRLRKDIRRKVKPGKSVYMCLEG